MALKDFTLGQMVAVSGPWFDPQNKACQALQGIAAAKGFLPLMDKRYQVLLGIPRAGSGQEIERLTGLLTDANARHANTGRGLHKCLEALSEFAQTPERKAEYLDLSALLFPNGLKGAIGTDYTTESGQGTLLAQRLDSPARARLRAIPLPADEGGNLEAVTDRWIAEAADLGTLENQRSAALRAQNPDAKPSNVRAEMFAWMKAVKTLKNIIKQADVSQETWDTIFGDLENEERGAKKTPAKPATEPTP